jgi:antitoxin component HigA of HigAB toxin-antitoxin module
MTTRKRPPRKRPTRETLAINLQGLMTARGYNQDDVAERSEPYGRISQKTVSNILNQRHSVYLEQIDTLADTFGILPSDLISESLEIRK